jgi:ADP-ribose pyrophosphatase YjhB (NUDIX family)
LKDAVTREALEETGLHVVPGRLVELLERIFPDQDGRIRFHYVIADYLCRVTGGQLRAGSDVSEAVWVTRDRLELMNLPSVTMRVILKAIDQ